MAQYLGGTLLAETRSYRQLLEAHARIPLQHVVDREGASEDADHGALGVKLAAVTFKIRLLDALIDLFRLYDDDAIEDEIAHEAATRTGRWGVALTEQQIAAMRRVRLRTRELDRQIAFAHAAHLLLATDGMRHRDRELYPVEFELLDERFGRNFAQWVIAVAPTLAAFCRNPGLETDIRLRAALDDFVFQLRKVAPAGADRAPIAPDLAQHAVAGHAD